MLRQLYRRYTLSTILALVSAACLLAFADIAFSLSYLIFFVRDVQGESPNYQIVGTTIVILSFSRVAGGITSTIISHKNTSQQSLTPSQLEVKVLIASFTLSCSSLLACRLKEQTPQLLLLCVITLQSFSAAYLSASVKKFLQTADGTVIGKYSEVLVKAIISVVLTVMSLSIYLSDVTVSLRTISYFYFYFFGVPQTIMLCLFALSASSYLFKTKPSLENAPNPPRLNIQPTAQFPFPQINPGGTSPRVTSETSTHIQLPSSFKQLSSAIPLQMRRLKSREGMSNLVMNNLNEQGAVTLPAVNTSDLNIQTIYQGEVHHRPLPIGETTINMSQNNWQNLTSHVPGNGGGTSAHFFSHPGQLNEIDEFDDDQDDDGMVLLYPTTKLTDAVAGNVETPRQSMHTIPTATIINLNSASNSHLTNQLTVVTGQTHQQPQQLQQQIAKPSNFESHYYISQLQIQKDQLDISNTHLLVHQQQQQRSANSTSVGFVTSQANNGISISSTNAVYMQNSHVAIGQVSNNHSSSILSAVSSHTGLSNALVIEQNFLGVLEELKTRIVQLARQPSEGQIASFSAFAICWGVAPAVSLSSVFSLQQQTQQKVMDSFMILLCFEVASQWVHGKLLRLPSMKQRLMYVLGCAACVSIAAHFLVKQNQQLVGVSLIGSFRFLLRGVCDVQNFAQKTLLHSQYTFLSTVVVDILGNLLPCVLIWGLIGDHCKGFALIAIILTLTVVLLSQVKVLLIYGLNDQQQQTRGQQQGNDVLAIDRQDSIHNNQQTLPGIIEIDSNVDGSLYSRTKQRFSARTITSI